jgi:hypothetical protein
MQIQMLGYAQHLDLQILSAVGNGQSNWGKRCECDTLLK